MKTTVDGLEMDFEDDLLDGRPAAAYDPLRTPYLVREQDFPRRGSLDAQMLFLLRYAILAPSTHNTQPWRFALIGEEGIAVYADYTRRMPALDPGNRELLMSIGAALFNIRVAAAHFRMPCQIQYNLSGDSERPLAMVSLAPAQAALPAGHEHLEGLFPALPARHTNRNAFLLSRVPASAMQRLTAAAEGSQVDLVFSVDGTVNQQVAGLVSDAEQRQWADPSYRRDIAEWIRQGATPEADGIPGAAFGWEGALATLGQYAARTIDQGRLRAARDRNLCIDAPGLLVVTSEDSLPHWLEAGEVMERLLLTVMQEGLQYSFFNMPVQLPEFRTRLKALLGCALWPQLLLRVGYCLTPPAPTPRKPLQELLIVPAAL